VTVASLFPDIETAPARKDATLSDCGLYRYDLLRSWAVGPHVTFVMMNPSTADAEDDDPTIRRCVGFAKSWGFAGLVVVNLYAFRATEVSDLWEAADPVGPKNDLHIEAHAFCGMTVAAWGAKRRAARRAAGVVARLTAKGRKLYAIRETKSGWPEHPLFLPAHLKPFAWRPTPTP
jgi:hypothetical protein